jgi:hypothetical protein
MLQQARTRSMATTWIVSYTGDTGNDFVITAVPEPSTWLASILAAGVIAYSQRRRFARLVRRKL